MKRSSSITLLLVTAAAAALTGCKEKPTRYCVDSKNQVSDDWDCQDENRARSGGHHWYYGGGRGFVPLGTRLAGGSTSVPPESFSARSATARGVIGGAGESAAAHGAGE